MCSADGIQAVVVAAAHFGDGGEDVSPLSDNQFEFGLDPTDQCGGMLFIGESWNVLNLGRGGVGIGGVSSRAMAVGIGVYVGIDGVQGVDPGSPWPWSVPSCRSCLSWLLGHGAWIGKQARCVY